MTVLGYDSPQRAAMVGFPEKYCRVLATLAEGDDAYVLLDTGPAGQPYLYGSCCVRRDGRWHEFTNGNGPGWAQTDPDSGVGPLSFWDEAPAGADAIRVEFKGETVDVPVTDGAFLAVWWRQPDPDLDWPRVIAHRIDGTWRS